MTIGEVIRKYRREKQMTQEEMAGRLGVTAPAVNKWENDHSCPDVALLAPIARLLGISTDTLLSYREELTEQEINGMLEMLSQKVRTEGYEAAFSWAQEQIREYPNCIALVVPMAQALDGYRLFFHVPEPERYDEQIHAFYLRGLECTDSDVVQSVLVSLFQNALLKEDYESAEKYLERLPGRKINPTQLRANLCLHQGKEEEAYPLYERIILAGFTDISGALNGLWSLAMKEEDRDRAVWITEKQSKLAALLEMGPYMERSPELNMAAADQDKDRVLAVLNEMVERLGDVNAYQKSPLYAHLKPSGSKCDELAHMLWQALECDESMEYIKEEPEYRRLIERLERYMKAEE